RFHGASRIGTSLVALRQSSAKPSLRSSQRPRFRVHRTQFDRWQPPSDDRVSKPQPGIATLNMLANDRRRTTNDVFANSERRPTSDQQPTPDVLRNRSRADVRVRPRTGPDATPQV